MRHYFGYDINGKLLSVEVYGPVGWPAHHCLDDGSCHERSVTSLRESRAKDLPGVINWVAFDCDCDPAQGALLRDCTCINDKYSNHYVSVESKTLVPKPTRTVFIDDEVVTHRSVITKSPGTVVTLKIVSPGVADGTKITCSQKGAIDLTLDDEWELTFTDGETDTKALVTPAHGTKGMVQIKGARFRALHFFVRGFTTS